MAGTDTYKKQNAEKAWEPCENEENPLHTIEVLFRLNNPFRLLK